MKSANKRTVKSELMNTKTIGQCVNYSDCLHYFCLFPLQQVNCSKVFHLTVDPTLRKLFLFFSLHLLPTPSLSLLFLPIPASLLLVHNNNMPTWHLRARAHTKHTNTQGAHKYQILGTVGVFARVVFWSPSNRSRCSSKAAVCRFIRRRLSD